MPNHTVGFYTQIPARVVFMELLSVSMRVQSPEWLQKAQESGSVHKQSTMQIEKSCFTYAGKN